MKKQASFYFTHILNSAKAIREYTKAGKRSFFGDQKTQDAVIRNLEIIGEAVKHLPTEATAGYPDIPWKQIAGMRDRLIH